jgi:predicted metalloprotease with PDZ domain
VTLSRDATITGVLWDSPAFRSGLTVGARLIAVNGIAYDSELLKEAIANARTGPPVSLIVKQGDHYKVVALDHHAGLRYPRLERVPGAPDRISAIYAPK